MIEQQSALTEKRRNLKKPEKDYDDGFLRVEHQNYYVSCGEQPLKLTRVEFMLISLLAKRIGSFVSPESLWKPLRKDKKRLNIESLKVYVCHLRRCLTPFGIRIETAANGGGYRLLPASGQHS